jgi:hypothetical protein
MATCSIYYAHFPTSICWWHGYAADANARNGNDESVYDLSATASW